MHRHLRTARVGSPVIREVSCSSSKPDPEQLQHVRKGCLKGFRGMRTKYHALRHNGQIWKTRHWDALTARIFDGISVPALLFVAQ
jgi:hypothetical protein